MATVEDFTKLGDAVNAAVDHALNGVPDEIKMVVEASIGASMVAAAIALSKPASAHAKLTTVVAVLNMAADAAGLGINVAIVKAARPGRVQGRLN